MGEVFLAALERTGGFEKQVALKCVLPGLMSDPRFVELFEKEARLAAALTHRNIVQIFDFGQDQGRSWLAMEYVRGVDLKAVMDLTEGPLPLGLVVEIGAACARGLDYAHRARDARGKRLAVIHRDVSPQNVLLSFEGDVKLADFGLAQAAALGAEENRALQGKIAYMSPEQAGGEILDGRTDQFSLGTILFEMLTGHRAFFGNDGPQAILERVSEGKPQVSLEVAAPSLHPALADVIHRSMAPDRRHRFEDAGQFGDALTRAAAVAGIPLGVPPLGSWLRTLFPNREMAAVAKGVDPMEATAIASNPSANESTLVAETPISGPESSVSGIEHTAAAVDPISDSVTPHQVSETSVTDVRPTPSPETFVPSETVVETESGGGTRRAWMLVSLAALVGALVIWVQRTPDLVFSPDAGLIIDAGLAVDVGRVEDAHPPDVQSAVDGSTLLDTSVGEGVDAERSAIRPRLDARVTPTRRHVRRRDPAKAVRQDAAVVSAPPPRKPIVDASVPPIADAGPRKPPPVLGPRIRANAERGTVRVNGVVTGRTWVPIAGRGLLVDAQGPGGPRVRTRVTERGGRFVSTITAKPFGQIFLNERPMGESPKAGIPLKAGRSTISVRTVDGHETRLIIELAH